MIVDLRDYWKEEAMTITIPKHVMNFDRWRRSCFSLQHYLTEAPEEIDDNFGSYYRYWLYCHDVDRDSMIKAADSELLFNFFRLFDFRHTFVLTTRPNWVHPDPWTLRSLVTIGKYLNLRLKNPFCVLVHARSTSTTIQVSFIDAFTKRSS